MSKLAKKLVVVGIILLIMVLVLLAMLSRAEAWDVTLQWDHSVTPACTETGNQSPCVSNYVLCVDDRDSPVFDVNLGTDVGYVDTYTMTGLRTGIKYHFVVAAKDANTGYFSGFSNRVTAWEQMFNIEPGNNLRVITIQNLSP